MSMKDIKQLPEDAATNEELAKKLEEAYKEMLKTGDKAALITAVAELGYEVTEQDFPDDDFVKLDESSSTMWRADTSGSTRKPRTNMR